MQPISTTERALAERTTCMADFFPSHDSVRVAELAAWLDGLSDDERAAAVVQLRPRQQAALYEAARGFHPITLDHFVPAGTPPREPVIHSGRNSLLVCTRFEKHFCKPEARATELWGYNETPRAARAVAGPGYFVSYAIDAGEVLVDYCRIPPETLACWPRLVPNDPGILGRFVFHGTKDTMRFVSGHVSVGRAARGGRSMDNWFVLCRRERTC